MYPKYGLRFLTILFSIFIISSCFSICFDVNTYIPIKIVDKNPRVVPQGEYLFEMRCYFGGRYAALLEGPCICFYDSDTGSLIKTYGLNGVPITWTSYMLSSKEWDSSKINFVYTYSSNDVTYLSCINSPEDKIEFSQNWEVKTACDAITHISSKYSESNTIYLISRNRHVYQKYDHTGKLVKTINFKEPVLSSYSYAYDGQNLYSNFSETKYYLHEKKSINKAFVSKLGILYDGECLYGYDYQNNKDGEEDSIVCIKFPGLKNTPRPLGTILTNNGILLEHGGMDTYEYMQIVQGSYDALPVINTSKSLYKKNYVFSERGSSVSFFYKEVDGAIKIIALDYNKMAFSFDNNSSPMVDMILIYELENIPGKLLSDVEMVRDVKYIKEEKPYNCYVDPDTDEYYQSPGKVVNGIYVPPKTRLVFNTTEGVYECDITRVFENVYIDRINNKTPGIILDHGKITDQRNGKDKIVFYKPEVRHILPENDNKK